MNKELNNAIRDITSWLFGVLLFCILQWTGAITISWWWILLPILWPEAFYLVGIVWLVGKVTNAW